jgi:hypothetical protein
LLKGILLKLREMHDLAAYRPPASARGTSAGFGSARAMHGFDIMHHLRHRRRARMTVLSAATGAGAATGTHRSLPEPAAYFSAASAAA